MSRELWKKIKRNRNTLLWILTQESTQYRPKAFIHGRTRLRDVDSGQFLHGVGEAGHDVQNLSWQFGCSHVSSSTRHHGDFFGFTQRLADLLCHLMWHKIHTRLKLETKQMYLLKEVSQRPSQTSLVHKTTPCGQIFRWKMLLTRGSFSSSMSTMAPSLYSWKASAFFTICSASARPLASTAKASASPLTWRSVSHVYVTNLQSYCCMSQLSCTLLLSLACNSPWWPQLQLQPPWSSLYCTDKMKETHTLSKHMLLPGGWKTFHDPFRDCRV